MSDIVCTLTKNSREKIVFRVGEFKGHRFVDLRIFVAGENGNEETPHQERPGSPAPFISGVPGGPDAG